MDTHKLPEAIAPTRRTRAESAKPPNTLTEAIAPTRRPRAESVEPSNATPMLHALTEAIARARPARAESVEHSSATPMLHTLFQVLPGNVYVPFLVKSGRLIELLQTSKCTRAALATIYPKIPVSLALSTPYKTFTDIEDGLQRFSRLDIVSIVSLDMGACEGDCHPPMKDSNFEGLATALCTHTRLAALKLYRNDLTHISTSNLTRVLVSCTGISELNLGGNPLCDAGARGLSLVLGQMTGLRILVMDQCCLSHDARESLAAPGALPLCSSLSVLSLNDNRMGRSVIRRFLQEAHKWPELTVFRMGRNGGGTASSGDYLEELGHFSNLEHLDFQRHHFSPFQVAMLGEQLWERTTLTKLYLGSIMIRDAFEYFDAAISSCIHLQELDISGNSIGSKGVKFFTDGLCECTELVKLDICANGQIDTAAEDSLVEMFTQCCTRLMALNIRGLGASQDACEKIESGMIQRAHRSDKKCIAVANNNYYFTDASDPEDSDSD